MGKFQNSDIPIEKPTDDLLGISTSARLLARRIMHVETPFTIGVYGEWGSGKTSFVNLIKHSLVNEYKAVKFITFSAWPYATTDTLWRALVIKIVKDLYDIADIHDDTRPLLDKAQENFLTQISNFLIGKNLVLWSPPPPSPQNENEQALREYEQFINILDKTSYGSLSKDVTQHYQINQEVAMMAIVNAAMDALGTISPLLAAVRRFLGFKSEYNLSDFLHQTKNQAVRDSIESIQEFKEIFHEAFKKRSNKYGRVFVFIDDLDRCLPDVALDLLEAIKIFFDEIGCVFIIAADEHLIGQGLRLRYKTLLSSAEGPNLQEFFVQKGREYFEKIIQFGIKVPPRTPEQIREFISSQFPKWILTADILETVIGSNPRRLQQQCRLLSYQYDIGLEQKQAPTDGLYGQFPLLDKMIALYKLCAKYSEGRIVIQKLLQDINKYYETMQELEMAFIRCNENTVDCENLSREGKILCRVAIEYPILANVFSQWDIAFSIKNLDKYTFEQLEMLTGFVDMKPSLKPTWAVFETRDKVFLRVFEAVSKTRSIPPSELLREAETKLLSVYEWYPEIADLLIKQATTGQWKEQILAVDVALGSVKTTETIELNALSRKILTFFDHESRKSKNKLEQDNDLVTIEVQTTGIPATLLKELQQVLLHCGPFESDYTLRAIFVDDRLARWRSRLPEANTPINRVNSVIDLLYQQTNDNAKNGLILLLEVLREQTTPQDACSVKLNDLITETNKLFSSSPSQKMNTKDPEVTTELTAEKPFLQDLLLSKPYLSTITHNEVVGILLYNQQEKEIAQRSLNWRIEAARHILRLRKFVKLYALDARWPELGRQFREDNIVLEELEKLALQPNYTSANSIALRLWKDYEDDMIFVKFLNLHPFFAEIYPDERYDYFVASQQIERSFSEVPEKEQRPNMFKVPDNRRIHSTIEP